MRSRSASVTALCAITCCLLCREASAEVSVKVGDWEIFSDGRMGGFVNYVKGQAFPQSTFVQTDPNDPTTRRRSQAPFGGGIDLNSAESSNPAVDPANPNPLNPPQGTLDSMRVRSGFLSNIMAVGFRTHVTPDTVVTGYVQFWSDVESLGRRKYVPMPVDVRQGYAKLEGPYGSLIVGRQLTLFSRGAADIDFLYGHGYGVGLVTGVDSGGTAAGHVGTGVLGPGFAAGAVYVTPNLNGLKLNVGVFDPVSLQGAWDRTKYVRPEAELTYDREFGSRGKLHLFVNGGYQKVYRNMQPDSVSTEAYGTGYGGRVEIGPVHLGLAGHYGQGLGLYYALETTEAAYDGSALARLRKSDGYYAQAQLALTKFDINAGVGISRVTPLGARTNPAIPADGALPIDPATGLPDPNGTRQSLIKYQLGMSAAIVYHMSSSVHFDVDYFRAQFRWQLGEHQDVNFVSAGVTMTW